MTVEARERRTSTIPTWTAVTVILSLIVGASGIVASSLSAQTLVKFKAVEDRVSKEEAISIKHDDRIVNLEKLMERSIANAEALTKIIDRLEKE
jgi:hypothetical protein